MKNIKNKKSLVVNLFGGPGLGKSTFAAGLFAELKRRHTVCEMSMEFAKELVYANDYDTLADQMFVFGEQHRRLYRLTGQVDIIIAEAPLLHSIIYYPGENFHFPEMVREEHRSFWNLNVLLERVHPFRPEGRFHTEEQAKEIDIEALELASSGDPVHVFPASGEAVPLVADLALTTFSAGAKKR